MDKCKFIYQCGDIGVKPLSVDELGGAYPSWFSDMTVCQFNRHGAFPKNPDDIKAFVQSIHHSNNEIVWAVYHLGDRLHIGNISLQNISLLDRTGELALLFGEVKYWGKGYAYQASCLLIQHGFARVNLNRIYCGVAAKNIGMQKLATKLGMLQEGCRREALYLNGEYTDIIEYGLLRNEADHEKFNCGA